MEKKEKKFYICTNCGFSPTNRSTWCDLGCGRDYNEMQEITHRKVLELLDKARKEGAKVLTFSDEELSTVWKALGETDMLWKTESKENKILSKVTYKIAKWLTQKKIV